MTHWPFCTTYSAGAYEPSGHCSAIAGSPSSPQSGPAPEDDEDPELEPELDAPPELEPELLPPVVVGSSWPEQAAKKAPPMMVTANGKEANRGRIMNHPSKHEVGRAAARGVA